MLLDDDHVCVAIKAHALPVCHAIQTLESLRLDRQRLSPITAAAQVHAGPVFPSASWAVDAGTTAFASLVSNRQDCSSGFFSSPTHKGPSAKNPSHRSGHHARSTQKPPTKNGGHHYEHHTPPLNTPFARYVRSRDTENGLDHEDVLWRAAPLAGKTRWGNSVAGVAAWQTRWPL
jgi:hypothetical protein